MASFSTCRLGCLLLEDKLVLQNEGTHTSRQSAVACAMQVDVFAETTAVAVHQCLSIAECLEQRVCLREHTTSVNIIVM